MCGILGILLADPNGIASCELLEGCHYLQHRGQDAAGIITCGPYGRLYQCKGNGMARDVFTQSRLNTLVGNLGVAHLRYPTAGSFASSEAQPFYVNSPYGLVMAHNGNLVNAPALRQYLDGDVHRHINTDSDSELLLNIFAAELQKTDKARVNDEDIFDALRGVYRECRGAYACVGMVAGYGLIAFRDPHGIRPLVLGERESDVSGMKDYLIASESIALEAMGFNKWVDILPGQAVIIPKNSASGPVIRQLVSPKAHTPDIFEYVYFARPDSVIDGISVYRSRLAMGDRLAETVIKQFGSLKAVKTQIDVVIPVPDTARCAALETAVYLGLPYREGFVKNRYVGRTFIMPNQKERQSSVRRKLNAMSLEFQNRNVLIVDDSIVRGTTSREIVQMARDAGARKVFFASCAPPIRHNHIYGIDLADTKALVAYNKPVDEDIARAIGADKVIFQRLDDLIEACSSVIGASNAPATNGFHLDSRPTSPSPDPDPLASTVPYISTFEVGVFTGSYVTGVEQSYLEYLERIRAQNQKLKDLENQTGLTLNRKFDPISLPTTDSGAKADSDISLFNPVDTTN